MICDDWKRVFILFVNLWYYILLLTEYNQKINIINVIIYDHVDY